jgi:hypothetical protein
MANYTNQLNRLALASLILIAACSPNAADNPVAVSATDALQPKATVGIPEAQAADISLGEQVSAAQFNLANRAGISADKIVVSEARVVNWGSSAIGCPQTGMSYTQAIVPGVQLLLKANGITYHYHGHKGGKLIFCPDNRVEEPAYGPGKEFM